MTGYPFAPPAVPVAAMLFCCAASIVVAANVGDTILIDIHGRTDFRWMEEHTVETLAALASGDTFAAAADPRQPSGYTKAAARDLAAVVMHAGKALVDGPLATTTQATEALLRAPYAGSCSRGDEAVQQALLLATLANISSNGTLFCDHATPVVYRLLLLGSGGCNGSSAGGFRDGLVFSEEPIPGYGYTFTTLAAGHQLVASALLHKAATLVEMASTRFGCLLDHRAPLRQLATTIAGGLGSSILWDNTTGLYHPASRGPAAALHDVWGSALAAEAGGRESAVSAWLAENWADSFQNGAPRHLAPGQFWPSSSTSTWQRGTYMNGGYWPLASAAVLPLLARKEPNIAAELIHSAVRLARRRGSVDEWTNEEFCSNCRGEAVYTDRLTPYPSSASLRGVARHGASTAGLYAATRAVVSARVLDVPLRQEPLPQRRLASAGPLIATAESDLAWMTAVARQWLAGAIVSPQTGAGAGTPIYPPAADPNTPSAYGFLYTRDFEYVLEFAGRLMSKDELSIAAHGIADILLQTPSVPAGGYGIGDEMPFRVKLVLAFANLNSSASAFNRSAPSIEAVNVCTALPGLWEGLNSTYSNPLAFRDGLLYSAQPQSAYGFTDSIAKSGHHLFISVLHLEALQKLIPAAARCPEAVAIVSAMRERAADLKAGLAGTLLWNQSVGMFRPSSGNCAGLIDVWGSALAVHTGVTTPQQTKAIVNWFGTNWQDVFQDGQVRHLPKGQYWPVIGPAVAPSPGYWEYDTYQNGGFWATPLAWVAPVLALADTRLAAWVVRAVIADGKKHGFTEWINHDYCSNCAGDPVPVPSQPRLGGGPPQQLTAYPMSGEWWGGAANYGSSIASVYAAAAQLLAPQPPPPPPPPPPPGRPPTNCSVSGDWRFTPQSGMPTEINRMLEYRNGSVQIWPGKNDPWKQASGQVYSDWTISISYYFDSRVKVSCNIDTACRTITCPRYKYARVTVTSSKVPARHAKLREDYRGDNTFANADDRHKHSAAADVLVASYA